MTCFTTSFFSPSHLLHARWERGNSQTCWLVKRGGGGGGGKVSYERGLRDETNERTREPGRQADCRGRRRRTENARSSRRLTTHQQWGPKERGITAERTINRVGEIAHVVGESAARSWTVARPSTSTTEFEKDMMPSTKRSELTGPLKTRSLARWTCLMAMTWWGTPVVAERRDDWKDNTALVGSSPRESGHEARQTCLIFLNAEWWISDRKKKKWIVQVEPISGEHTNWGFFRLNHSNGNPVT